MQEEIFESIDAVDSATDFGNKFISNHQVVLGGFEKAKNELLQVQDLILNAKGSSLISANYGAYIMRQLEIFNTIRCIDSDEINSKDFVDMKYGGFCSITQSGADKNVIKAMRMAYKQNLTCFNVVNVENSPITKLIDQIRDEDLMLKKQNSSSQNIIFNASDEDSEEEIVDKNIGLYQKSGHCYSDVKSFIPQVVCLALIGIWFSDKKQNQSVQSIE